VLVTPHLTLSQSLSSRAPTSSKVITDIELVIDKSHYKGWDAIKRENEIKATQNITLREQSDKQYAAIP
jgi:hypothetical protein